MHRLPVNRWIPPPVAFAIAALAMWALTRYGPFVRHAFPYQRATGITLIVIGLLVLAVSLGLFATAHTSPNPIEPMRATRLVTSGIYAYSRNPMYLGDAIVLLGIDVLSGSAVALVFVAAFVIYIDKVQIAAEEAALAKRFGDAYAEYRQRVRRWL
ncbi:MAG TPA: isoprenylcysteine carboxylmethyltransferase family protein [Burkholderiaceae bacterium]|nr:isoprenylcysteine carboxylmethyltransferase family protein [Burkholderiaceae bacterium]